MLTVGQAIALGILLGLVGGAALMVIWSSHRMHEEATRQFDRGFERGRWLTEVRGAGDDGGASDRMAQLLAGVSTQPGQLAIADPDPDPAKRLIVHH